MVARWNVPLTPLTPWECPFSPPVGVSQQHRAGMSQKFRVGVILIPREGSQRVGVFILLHVGVPFDSFEEFL